MKALKTGLVRRPEFLEGARPQVRRFADGARFRRNAKRHHPKRRHLAGQRHALAHEKRLAKHPVADEVHELLAAQDIGSDLTELVLDLPREFAAEHRRKIRLAEVSELVAGRALDERFEVERLVLLFQMIVQDVVVTPLAQVLGLGAHKVSIDRCVALHRLGEKLQHGSRLRDACPGIRDASRVEDHRVADGASRPPPGQRVVAHVRDAGG